MIEWLMKGILRDKTRSLFPFLIVTVGVALTVGLLGFMDGIFMGMIDTTSHLDTGHLRFVNKPFYDEEHLNPLDRALAAQKETHTWLKDNTDERLDWAPRIRWGALMDVPDENGNTRSQTPVVGMAIDLLSPDSRETERLDLKDSLVVGRLPENSSEMVVGYQLAETLKLSNGDTITLIGQSFDGGLATDNYSIVGFIRFGVTSMDKRMAVMDITGAQRTFYLDDMVTDWLGFFPRGVSYHDYDKIKHSIKSELTAWMKKPPASWAKDDHPIILSVLDQRNLGEIVRKFELIRGVILSIFTFLMVLVLWNAGLLSGIHRYGEMGLRLALGETHRGLVGLLTFEAFMIGVAGSMAGCLVGGGVVYYLQEVGVNMGDAMAQSGMMINDVARGG